MHFQSLVRNTIESAQVKFFGLIFIHPYRSLLAVWYP
jgi:hypothetical protein